jgi:hypothetical protein
MPELDLPSITSVWLKMIDRAKEAKFRQFGKTADRAWAFLGKDYRELYVDAVDDRGEKFAYAEGAVFQTRRNLAREFINVYIPYVHAKVPTRIVAPRRPPLPADLLAMATSKNPQIAPAIQEAMLNQGALEPVDKLRCLLMQWWLNYLPSEYDLFREQRRALPEALVKGRAVMWTELQNGAYGMIPCSYYDTVDGLLCDPDARSWLHQGFIVRERCEHVVRIAEKFDLPKEKIRGSFNSNLAKSSTNAGGAKTGSDLIPRTYDKSGDVGVYYEIYSRMGIGSAFDAASEPLKKLDNAMSALGQNVYLAVMPGVEHPLNLPPEVLSDDSQTTQDEMRARLSWPIPFHEDLTDPWPCSPCDFYPNQNDPWATSPLEGPMPLLAFIDHAYSYMFSRVRTTSRELFLASKSLESAVVRGLIKGSDLEVIMVSGEPGIELDNLLKRVEFPELKRDLLLVVDQAETAFERAAGMGPEIYGSSPETQDRSATATQARESRLSSRPNDFADCVENWNARIASKEALASRLYVGKEIVRNLFDEPPRQVLDPSVTPEALEIAQSLGVSPPTTIIEGPLTQKWMELIAVELDQAAIAATELTYTVEAGSGRKKNQQKQEQDAKSLIEAIPNLMQVMQMCIQTQNMAPYNTMVLALSQLLDKSLDGMLMEQPPQQQPDPQAEQEAQMAQQEAQMKSQQIMQQLQMAQEKHQMDMQAAQDKHGQEMSQNDERMAMEQQTAEMDHIQNIVRQSQQHDENLREQSEKHAADLEMKRQLAKVQAQAAKSKPKPRK